MNRPRRAMIGLGFTTAPSPARDSPQRARTPPGTPPHTPYQPEISQGRLEALLNFPDHDRDLTGLPTSPGANLLDEGTAVAEAMAMVHR